MPAPLLPLEEPPLLLLLLVPALAVQVPLTQVPLQQSASMVHVVPMPEVALSGMQVEQSEERSQPVGQVTLQPDEEGLELQAAKTPAPTLAQSTTPSANCIPSRRLSVLMEASRRVRSAASYPRSARQ